MRFYQIISNRNQSEIDEIIISMSYTEVEHMLSVYEKISMVEYTDENGYECMFAILDDYLIKKISDIYTKYSIVFKLNDITKDIIFDNKIKIDYKNQYDNPAEGQILKLINEFKSNWISKDDILDKIIEKGVNSLSEFDIKLLES
jgi:hypothetical protein